MSSNASDVAKAIIFGIIMIIVGIAVISLQQELVPDQGTVFWMGVALILGGIAIIGITIRNAL